MTPTVTISLEEYESLKHNSDNWLAIRELEITSGDERRLRAEGRVAELELELKTNSELWRKIIKPIQDTLNNHGYTVTFQTDMIPIIEELLLIKAARQDENSEARWEG